MNCRVGRATDGTRVGGISSFAPRPDPVSYTKAKGKDTPAMSERMFETAILAGAPLILVRSFAPDRDARTLSLLEAFSEDNEDGGRVWNIFWWSLSQGLTRLNVGDTPSDRYEGDPMAMLMWLATTSNTVVFTTNIDTLAENPMSADAIYSLCGEFGAVKSNGSALVLIGPEVDKLPGHIANTAVRTEMDLPDQAQRALHIGKAVTEAADAENPVDSPSPREMGQLVEAAASLTTYEIEQAVSMSVVEHNKAEAGYLQNAVKQKMKRVGCLRWLDTSVNFDHVVGYDDAKKFLLNATAPQEDVRLNFKGALFLGVPGGGKSMISKALGNALGVPTILFNLADLLNSLVGKSEENLREALSVIDSLGLCVVLLDEIEKFVGGGGERDGGVQSRQLGVLLTWMNDRTSPALIMATCNAADKLPPEFTRAQRWDVVYYSDLPTTEQVGSLITMYGESYNVSTADDLIPFTTNWTGAEVEQAIKHMCRGFTAEEAAGRIVPVASRMGPKLEALRDFARKGCVDVNTGKPFGVTTSNKKPEAVRRVARRQASKKKATKA